MLGVIISWFIDYEFELKLEYKGEADGKFRLA